MYSEYPATTARPPKATMTSRSDPLRSSVFEAALEIGLVDPTMRRWLNDEDNVIQEEQEQENDVVPEFVFNARSPPSSDSHTTAKSRFSDASTLLTSSSNSSNGHGPGAPHAVKSRGLFGFSSRNAGPSPVPAAQTSPAASGGVDPLVPKGSLPPESSTKKGDPKKSKLRKNRRPDRELSMEDSDRDPSPKAQPDTQDERGRKMKGGIERPSMSTITSSTTVSAAEGSTDFGFLQEDPEGQTKKSGSGFKRSLANLTFRSRSRSKSRPRAPDHATAAAKHSPPTLPPLPSITNSSNRKTDTKIAGFADGALGDFSFPDDLMSTKPTMVDSRDRPAARGTPKPNDRTAQPAIPNGLPGAKAPSPPTTIPPVPAPRLSQSPGPGRRASSRRRSNVRVGLGPNGTSVARNPSRRMASPTRPEPRPLFQAPKPLILSEPKVTLVGGPSVAVDESDWVDHNTPTATPTSILTLVDTPTPTPTATTSPPRPIWQDSVAKPKGPINILTAKPSLRNIQHKPATSSAGVCLCFGSVGSHDSDCPAKDEGGISNAVASLLGNPRHDSRYSPGPSPAPRKHSFNNSPTKLEYSASTSPPSPSPSAQPPPSPLPARQLAPPSPKPDHHTLRVPSPTPSNAERSPSMHGDHAMLRPSSRLTHLQVPPPRPPPSTAIPQQPVEAPVTRSPSPQPAVAPGPSGPQPSRGRMSPFPSRPLLPQGVSVDPRSRADSSPSRYVGIGRGSGVAPPPTQRAHTPTMTEIRERFGGAPSEAAYRTSGESSRASSEAGRPSLSRRPSALVPVASVARYSHLPLASLMKPAEVFDAPSHSPPQRGLKVPGESQGVRTVASSRSASPAPTAFRGLISTSPRPVSSRGASDPIPYAGTAVRPTTAPSASSDREFRAEDNVKPLNIRPIVPAPTHPSPSAKSTPSSSVKGSDSSPIKASAAPAPVKRATPPPAAIDIPPERNEKSKMLYEQILKDDDDLLDPYFDDSDYDSDRLSVLDDDDEIDEGSRIIAARHGLSDSSESPLSADAFQTPIHGNGRKVGLRS